MPVARLFIYVNEYERRMADCAWSRRSIG